MGYKYCSKQRSFIVETLYLPFFIYVKHLYNFSCYFLSKLKQEKDFKTRIRNGEKSETLIAEPGPFLVGSGSDSRCKSDIKNLLNIVIPVYYAPQTSTKQVIQYNPKIVLLNLRIFSPFLFIYFLFHFPKHKVKQVQDLH